jgi:hypothetical protein
MHFSGGGVKAVWRVNQPGSVAACLSRFFHVAALLCLNAGRQNTIRRPNGSLGNYLKEVERKSFFSEEKKQKTFFLAGAGRSARPMTKFILCYFKRFTVHKV